ncbi:hypothetical protein B296_00044082 [Ensete ventricosum]|uniref:Uncharacterized protein n=1 Tax=Ensete ventricosum TaxID=4639 RepID=A0A426ZCA3_ENSVE|nr:hypothetical protein B296_00044082 [Ensete ventricosum]
MINLQRFKLKEHTKRKENKQSAYRPQHSCSQKGRSQPPSEHLVVVVDGLQVEILPESPDEGIGDLVDVLLLRCQALCSPRLKLSHTRQSSGVSSSSEQGSGGCGFAIFRCRCYSCTIDDRGGLRVASHGPKLPDNLETDHFLLEAFAGLDVGPCFSGSILPRRNKNIFRRGPRRLPCKRVWVPRSEQNKALPTRSSSTTHAYLPCDCTRTWDLFRCEFGT